jgi:hypothetical protein
VYSIGPEGRGGVGLGDGDAAATCSAAGAEGATCADCLQEVNSRTAPNKIQPQKGTEGTNVFRKLKTLMQAVTL